MNLTPRNWKVTFYKHDGTVQSTVVTCLKRFATWEANVELGYPAFYSKKITVGLVKKSLTFSKPHTYLASR